MRLQNPLIHSKEEEIRNRDLILEILEIPIRNQVDLDLEIQDIALINLEDKLLNPLNFGHTKE